MTDEKLVELARSGDGTAAHMETLYLRLRPLMASIARRFGCPEETEDLMQEGYLGLCQAVEHYRPETGVPFRGYAPCWIRRAMGRYLERCGPLVRIPADRAALLGRYQRLADSWEADGKGALSDREAARLLAVSLVEVGRLRLDLAMARPVSLDAVVGEDGETPLESLLKGQEGPESGVVEKLTGEELKRVLWACVDELGQEIAETVRCRYQGEMGIREMGRAMGEEDETIRFRLRKGLRKLRSPEKAACLRPYLEGTYERALRGTGAAAFRRTWTSATERAALEETGGVRGGGADRRRGLPAARRDRECRCASGRSR